MNFENAINYIENEKDSLCIAYNGQFLVECLSRYGEYEKAKKVYEKTCEYIPKRQYKVLYEPIINMANGVAISSGKSEVGINELDEITKYLRDESYNVKIKVYKAYYQCYLLDENYSMSVKYLLKAIKLSEKIGDNYNFAYLTSELGVMYCELRNYKEGEKSILHALDIINDNNIKNTYLENYVLINLLKLNLDLERYEKALEIALNLEKTYNEMEAESSRNFKEMIKLLEVNYYIDKGNFKLASNLLSDISKLVNSKETNSFYTYYFYYESLGKFHEKQNNFEDAAICYEKSLKISKEINILEINLLNKIINVYEKLNNKELEGKYQELLISEYKSEELIRTKENINYIVNNVDKEYQLMEANNRKILFYKMLLLFIIMSSIIINILMKKLKYLEKQNITDELTGIYNRKYFDFYYSEMIKKNASISIIMIDIDDFKKINDTYGHDIGDLAIKSTAKVIQNSLEKEDLAFRYGGEEFCILTEKSNENVIVLAENIRSFIESCKFKEELKVTISLGIGFSKETKDTLKKADENLYISKNNGKNKVIY